jgi:stress response protein YsnF
MIRSEEEVRLGPVERRPVERVRLRKVTVTENVQRTVPVRREEVRLETDPPPEGRIESAEDVDGDEA